MDVMYLRTRKCAALGCDSVSCEDKLFRFPTDPIRFAQWAAVSQNPRLIDGSQKAAFLCARHFDRSQFRDYHRVTLLQGATPSICIPSPTPDMPIEINIIVPNF